MPANRISGITVEIGADNKPFNRAISEINSHIKTTASELKDVERLLKLDPKNTELLAQQQKLLAQSVEQTKSRLDALKEAGTKLDAQFNDNKITQEEYTKQTDSLKREIIATEKSLEDLEKRAESSSKTMILSFEKTADKVSKFGDKISGAGEKLIPISAGIAALGGIAFKSAAELEDAFGATEQVFGGASNAIKQWAEDLESYYGIAEGEALEYANMMGSMLQNIGNLTEEEAAKQAQTLIALAADLSAMFGGTTESAVQALTGALKGNNSMLDNYGMAVNEATIKQKALEMGLIEEGKALSLASKQAATLALVMEQSGAAQGQAAREADGASGTMRAFAAEIKDLSGAFGKILLPIIAPIIRKIAEFIRWIGSLDLNTKKLVVTVGLFVAALGPTLLVIGKVITAVGNVSKAMVKAEAAANAMSKAISANPYTLVIAAAVALAAAIAALAIKASKGSEEYQKLTETARESAGVMKDISSEFEDSTADAEGSAYAAHELVDALKALEKQGVNTEAEQRQYADTVAELKELVPELNTEVDKNTGLLKVNTEVLHTNIDALKKQHIEAAFISQQTESLEQMGKLEAALYQAQAEVNKTTTKQNAIFEQLSSATGVSVERIRELINELGIQGDLLYSNLGITQEQIGQYEHLAFEAINLSYALSEESHAVQVNTDAIASQQLVVDEARAGWDLYNSQLEAAAGGTGNLAASTDTMVQTIVPLYEQLMGELDALETSYKESYTAAYEAISGEIGLFNNMSGTATTSVNSMITALDSQIAYMDEYAANMEAAIALGVDQGLIAQLNDGSQESAAILAGIVADGGANVDELNAKLQEVSKGKTDFAEEMAEMSTDFDAKMLQIQTQMGQTVEQMNRADEAGTAARQTVQGYLSGFSARLSEMYKMGRQLGAEVMRGYNEAVDINSPSKEAAWSMGMTIDGFVNQAYREMSKLYQVGSDMGASILAGFNGAGGMSMSPAAMTAPVLQSVVSGGRAYGGGHSNASGGGQTINQTNYFSNYQNRDGAAAVRDLNRKLGRLYV